MKLYTLLRARLCDTDVVEYASTVYVPTAPYRTYTGYVDIIIIIIIIINYSHEPDKSYPGPVECGNGHYESSSIKSESSYLSRSYNDSFTRYIRAVSLDRAGSAG